MKGICAFPRDVEAASLFSRLLLEDWEAKGQPESCWQSNLLMESVARDARSRISKGISAGLVCSHLAQLIAAPVVMPSLNKAAFLAAKVALDWGKTEVQVDGETVRVSLITDPKKAAQNFRDYAPAAHYWAARLIKFGPELQEYEKTRRALHSAEGFRKTLLYGSAAGETGHPRASEWAMRACPPELLYTSLGTGGYADSTIKALEGYINLNHVDWGYSR